MKKTKEKQVQINFRCGESMANALERMVKSSGESKSLLIRNLIRDSLKKASFI